MALTSNQKKLDKNKDGKLSKTDFKMLQSQERITKMKRGDREAQSAAATGDAYTTRKKKGGGKVMYRKAGREVGGGMTDEEIIAHYRAVGEQGIIGGRGMKEIRDFMKTDPTKESNIKKRMKGFDKAKKKKTLSKSPDVYKSKGGGKVMKYKKGGIVYMKGGGIIKANSGGQGIVDSAYTKV